MNQNDEPNTGMQLLASVRYFISSSVPLYRQDDIRQVLDSNGATPAATLKDALHIVTNSHRFEGSGEVEAGLHAVTVRVACVWKECAPFDLFIGPMSRSVARVGENATVSLVSSTYQCDQMRCIDLNFTHPTQL